MSLTTLSVSLLAGSIGLLVAVYLTLRGLKGIPRKYKIEFMQTIFSGIIGGLVFNLLFSVKQAISVDDIPGLISDFLLLVFTLSFGAFYYGHFAKLKTGRGKKRKRFSFW